MYILGIDTSCDDTASAVLWDGKKILSNIVSSQEAIHKRYGGIVPELASRRHIEMIWPVTEEALREAGITLRNLSAIAICHGPGLIGSLLVGCSFAKALCYSADIPLVPVNHLEGHIYSSFLRADNSVADIDFPFLALIVSGGHTSLYRVDGFGLYRELGRTRDDAAGEAYDKVSKLLSLGYPGGPIIDNLSRYGRADAISFPRAYLPGSLDFSFSGLKTAVRLEFHRQVKELPQGDSSQFVKDLVASFQCAVIDVLIKKVEIALEEEKLSIVALSGGVGANTLLRNELTKLVSQRGGRLYMPPPNYCTDNAAMIALAGYHNYLRGILGGPDLNPEASLPL